MIPKRYVWWSDPGLRRAGMIMMLGILGSMLFFRLDFCMAKAIGAGVCLWAGLSAYTYVCYRPMPRDPTHAACEQYQRASMLGTVVAFACIAILVV